MNSSDEGDDPDSIKCCYNPLESNPGCPADDNQPEKFTPPVKVQPEHYFHESEPAAFESGTEADESETEHEDTDESSESLSEYSQSTVINDNVKPKTGFLTSRIVKNVSHLEYSKKEIPIRQNVQGCRWSIILRSTTSEETKFVEYLTVLIKCDPLHSNSSWKVSAKAHITLHNFLREVSDHRETQNLEFTNDYPIAGIQPFIRFSDLDEMGFCENNQIQIVLFMENVQLTGCFGRIERPSPVDRVSVLNDYGFNLNNTDKHFNKTVLHLISSVFEEKQRNVPNYVPESDRSRKRLEILTNVYVGRTKITDDNVEEFIRAARSAQAWGLLKECIDYLLSPKCRLSYDQKLVITNKNSLKMLEANFISEIVNGPGIKYALKGYKRYSPLIQSLIDESSSS